MVLLAACWPGCGTSPQRAARRRSRSADVAPADGVEQSSPGPDRTERLRVRRPPGIAARPVEPPRETDVAKTGTVPYVMTTNEGDVTLTMDRSKTPCTVHSFTSLADQGFYDKTTCPRMADKGSSSCSAAIRPAPRAAVRATRSPTRLTGKETVQGRGRRDGQRRPEHQRLAVLPRLRRLASCSRDVHDLRHASTAGSRGGRRRSRGQGQDGSDPYGGGQAQRTRREIISVEEGVLRPRSADGRPLAGPAPSAGRAAPGTPGRRGRWPARA